MKQAFCLFIAVIFLFGAAVVHGSVSAGLQSIDCSVASSISFTIYIPDIDEWEGSTDERSWSLNAVDNDACEPVFSPGGLVAYSNIDVAICAPGDPATTPDDSKFQYKFVISVDAGAGEFPIAPVTFAYDHDYVVKCFYNREQENIMASFQPLHSLTDTGSGIGAEFGIAFTIHYQSNDAEVDSVIYLSTAVYGKIVITDPSGIPQSLDIHFREVTADNDNSAGGEFPLVADGCPASGVVSSTACLTTAEDRFYFYIFRFPGQTGTNRVFLKAKVIVCLSDTMSSVCRSECEVCNPSGRKRRDTLEQVQQTEFYVAAGPFEIQELNEESGAAADKDKRTPLPAYVIAVVAVCGLLAVAIVSAVVLIVFRRRRQNVANTELKNEDSVTA